MRSQNEHRGREKNEQIIPIGKKDLEHAIRRGIISLEVGTALWRELRDKNSISPWATFGLFTNQSSRPPSIPNLLSVASFVLCCLGIFTSILYSWAKFDAMGAAITCAIASACLCAYGGTLHATHRPTTLLASAVASIALLGYSLIHAGIASGVGLFSAKASFDVFGALPDSGSFRFAAIAFVATVGFFYYWLRFGYRSFLALALISTYILTAESLTLVVGELVKDDSIQAWSWIFVATIFIFIEKILPPAWESAFRPLKPQTIFEVALWMVLTKFVLDGSIGGVYYLGFNLLAAYHGISRRSLYKSILGIVGIVLSLSILIWVVAGWSLVAPLLLFLLAYVLKVARNNWSAFEKILQRK